MKDRNLPHSDNWATPPYIYDKLNDEYNFNFDPCPLEHDIKKWDGLEIEWKERNFINPPYSKDLKSKFILKAVEESIKGKLCVLLLPVSTSTKLFHDIILVWATGPIKFFKGRIKFIGHNTKGEFVSNKSPMHDSMLVVFDGRLSGAIGSALRGEVECADCENRHYKDNRIEKKKGIRTTSRCPQCGSESYFEV